MPNKRLLSMSSDDVERILKKHGFVLNRRRGSHLQYIGYIKEAKRRVTVIANQKRFSPKTLNSMIIQSGISEQEWLNSIS